MDTPSPQQVGDGLLIRQIRQRRIVSHLSVSRACFTRTAFQHPRQAYGCYRTRRSLEQVEKKDKTAMAGDPFGTACTMGLSSLPEQEQLVSEHQGRFVASRAFRSVKGVAANSIGSLVT